MKEKIKYLIRKPSQIFVVILSRFPRFYFFRELTGTNDPITLNVWFKQKVLGYNKQAYWVTHFTSKIVGIQNILVGIGSNPGYNPNCYIQGSGKLYIGNYSTFGQNCGILSGGHSIYNHNKLTTDQTTKIGSYCWIGLNSVILPGVELGDFTVVGAGAVVTKSFPEGHCVIGGNPAKLIKTLDSSRCVRFKYKHEYIGYIPKHKFEKFRKKHLNI